MQPYESLGTGRSPSDLRLPTDSADKAITLLCSASKEFGEKETISPGMVSAPQAPVGCGAQYPGDNDNLIRSWFPRSGARSQSTPVAGEWGQ